MGSFIKTIVVNGEAHTIKDENAQTRLSVVEKDILSKQDSLTESQLNAVNSGITPGRVLAYDVCAEEVGKKADKATTLNGYGITDAFSTDDVVSSKYIADMFK